MNKYFITCDNYLFCGMATSYVAIAKSQADFEKMLDLWAYENYADLGGETDAEDNEEYTQEELDEAPYWKVEDYNEELHGEWDWFELVYDGGDD